MLLDVVKPEVLKNIWEVIPGIDRWESRVAVLRDQEENLSPNVRTAILVSMLPKYFQEQVIESGKLGLKRKGEEEKQAPGAWALGLGGLGLGGLLLSLLLVGSWSWFLV